MLKIKNSKGYSVEYMIKFVGILKLKLNVNQLMHELEVLL
ncbi:hypothetical protein EV214_11612 [Marinisporobacter balticus]|uniref:Uncharacterized protein n=1 Tax=Marinisporobacter balticus TaxID=2018667 RepID=A0A4R2KH40_9FIRM|nr:hypothetical protein EV214_11612 [Marinisporobacter balticus]